MISCCLKNSLGRDNSTIEPAVPPQVTSRPPGASARIDRAQVAWPTFSNTTSARIGNPLRVEGGLGTEVDRPASASWLVPSVTNTRAPSAWPSMSPADDTPPPTPTTSIVSPARSRARRSMRHAVR